MTNLVEKEQIKEACKSYIASKGLSQNKLATQIGISAGTISQILNGNWHDIKEEMWRKVWNKVSSVQTISDVFETTDFKACTNACDAAKKHHLMVGIIGDTGMGKTTTLEAYAQRKNVFYVVYDKTMKPKQFFIALLREMGISFEGSINEMVNRIADELNTISNPLLIIDEAGKIIQTMILYLHVLRDKTHKNCGIVLGGMPYFKSNLIKFSNKEKEGYAEFYRRINIWHSLKGLSRSEIMHICKESGIEDEETIKEMQGRKKFGELYNAILLHNIQLKEN